MKLIKTNLSHLLTIIACIFIIISLIILIRVEPAEIYEISSYTAYPLYFWGFIVASLILGISILVLHAFNREKSNWWVEGFVIVLVANFLILLIPLFRGYEILGHTDPPYQLGYIKDIIQNGHIAEAFNSGQDFYPAPHIISTDLYFLANIDVNVVMKLLPPILFIFYICSSYLLACTISTDWRQRVLLTTIASLPIFIEFPAESQAYFVPRRLIFWQLPLMLFVFYNSRKSINYMICLLLILISAPFWHPTNGGVFLFGIVLLIGMASWFWQHYSSNARVDISRLDTREQIFNYFDVLLPALVIIIVWLAWFMSKWMFFTMVSTLANTVLFDQQSSELGSYVNLLGGWGLTISETIKLIFLRLGGQVIFYISAGLFSVVTWWKLIVLKKRSSLILTTFTFLFVASVLLVPVKAVSNLKFETKRILLYSIFFAQVASGLGIFEYLRNFKYKQLFVCILIVIFSVSAIQGVMATYASPITLSANDSVMKADTDGIKWLIDNGNENILVEGAVLSQHYLSASVVGTSNFLPNFRPNWTDNELPDHFGYDLHRNFGDSWSSDRYFIFHEIARVYYTQRMQGYEDKWRWTPQDYEKLETDQTVNRIYNNGAFEVFYVTGNY